METGQEETKLAFLSEPGQFTQISQGLEGKGNSWFWQGSAWHELKLADTTIPLLVRHKADGSIK